MEFQVRLTPRAEADLDEIYASTAATFSEEQAERWISALREEISSLETMPKRCPVVKKVRPGRSEVRQLLFGNGRNKNRVLSSIVGEVVLVHRVLHTAREF